MNRRLVYSRQARRDLVAIQSYIARESGNVDIGITFAEKLRRQCCKLASLPGTLGRARPDLLPGIRTFAFGSYVILFRYGDDRFEVVNILEGHRDIAAYFRQDDV